MICKKAHDWSGFVEVKTMITANITSGKYLQTRIEMMTYVSREKKENQSQLFATCLLTRNEYPLVLYVHMLW